MSYIIDKERIDKIIKRILLPLSYVSTKYYNMDILI